LGRRDHRLAPPGRSFEIAPAAGGWVVAGLAVGVVVQLPLSPLGDHPQDPQV